MVGGGVSPTVEGEGDGASVSGTVGLALGAGVDGITLGVSDGTGTSSVGRALGTAVGKRSDGMLLGAEDGAIVPITASMERIVARQTVKRYADCSGVGVSFGPAPSFEIWALSPTQQSLAPPALVHRHARALKVALIRKGKSEKSTTPSK